MMTLRSMNHSPGTQIVIRYEELKLGGVIAEG
jgi:hypothetical protein